MLRVGRDTQVHMWANNLNQENNWPEMTGLSWQRYIVKQPVAQAGQGMQTYLTIQGVDDHPVKKVHIMNETSLLT